MGDGAAVVGEGDADATGAGEGEEGGGAAVRHDAKRAGGEGRVGHECCTTMPLARSSANAVHPERVNVPEASSERSAPARTLEAGSEGIPVGCDLHDGEPPSLPGS